MNMLVLDLSRPIRLVTLIAGTPLLKISVSISSQSRSFGRYLSIALTSLVGERLYE